MLGQPFIPDSRRFGDQYVAACMHVNGSVDPTPDDCRAVGVEVAIQLFILLQGATAVIDHHNTAISHPQRRDTAALASSTYRTSALRRGIRAPDPA